MRRSPLHLSILFAVAIAGAGCAASKGRSAGEACADTADCRDDLACFQGRCASPDVCPAEAPIECADMPGTCCQLRTPYCCAKDGLCHVSAADCNAPTCASSGKSCNLSTDCCGGLVCRQLLCQRPTAAPVCGNGQCEAGESQATCCSDCGCPAGLSCQAGQCKAAGTTLTWTITNNCFNGENIQFRFFSETRGLQWPGGNLAFISNPGIPVAQALACSPGEQICFGGNQPIHGLAWGVNIDNSLTCPNCCAICANGTAAFGPMTCP